MLKKKRFDAGLFCEAFRQIRMPGILFTVIFTLEAILIPLSTVINRMNSDFYQTHQAGVQSVTGYSDGDSADASAGARMRLTGRRIAESTTENECRTASARSSARAVTVTL